MLFFLVSSCKVDKTIYFVHMEALFEKTSGLGSWTAKIYTRATTSVPPPSTNWSVQMQRLLGLRGRGKGQRSEQPVTSWRRFRSGVGGGVWSRSRALRTGGTWNCEATQ